MKVYCVCAQNSNKQQASYMFPNPSLSLSLCIHIYAYLFTNFFFRQISEIYLHEQRLLITFCAIHLAQASFNQHQINEDCSSNYGDNYVNIDERMNMTKKIVDAQTYFHLLLVPPNDEQEKAMIRESSAKIYEIFCVHVTKVMRVYRLDNRTELNQYYITKAIELNFSTKLKNQFIRLYENIWL